MCNHYSDCKDRKSELLQAHKGINSIPSRSTKDAKGISIQHANPLVRK